MKAEQTQNADPWELLIEGANATVDRARSGDYHAAMEVIEQAAIAIASTLQFDEPDPGKLRLDVSDLADPRRLIFHEQPDPYRLVYLRALLLSLRDISAGADPAQALGLMKPDHRLADPDRPVMEVLLWMQVGEEHDRRIERGHTRQDKPIDGAIEHVANRSGVSADVVQKAWSNHGSLRGWLARRDDVKAGIVDRK